MLKGNQQVSTPLKGRRGGGVTLGLERTGRMKGLGHVNLLFCRPFPVINEWSLNKRSLDDYNGVQPSS